MASKKQKKEIPQVMKQQYEVFELSFLYE